MNTELAMSGPLIKPGPGEPPIYGTLEKDLHIETSAAALAAALKNRGLARGFAILWQVQNVLWGRVEDGQISFADSPTGNEKTDPVPLDNLPSEYWQELRVFNDDAELRLTRRGGELVGRFRSDAGGETQIEYVDAMARLWGERDDETIPPDGYVHLADRTRDLSMTVPCDDTACIWYGLVTRNYIEAAEETSQAGYADYRFVRIVGADMKGE